MVFTQKACIAAKRMVAAGAVIATFPLADSGLIAWQARRIVRQLSGGYGNALGFAAARKVSGGRTGVQQTAISMASTIGAAHENRLRDRAAVMAMLKPNLDVSQLVMGSWCFAAPDAFDGQDS